MSSDLDRKIRPTWARPKVHGRRRAAGRPSLPVWMELALSVAAIVLIRP